MAIALDTCSISYFGFVMQYAKQLADDLREKIKALGYDRHKLVVQVNFIHPA